MPRKVSQQGQALVIIIMVMVLSLATGLAVSNRSTSSVHQTANIANSEQALATAESAAEELLSMSFVPCTSPNEDCNASVVGEGGYFNKDSTTVSCNDFGARSQTNLLGFDSYCEKIFGTSGSGGKALVTVRNTPDVTAGSPFEFFLEKDDTQQVWVNATALAGPVALCWQKVGGAEPSAALEVKVISGTSPTYTMSNYAFDPDLSRRGENGFSATGTVSDPTYTACTNVTLPTSTQALRIRAFYGGVSVSLKPSASDPPLPFQGYIIVAQGQVGDVKRTVQVVKAKPQLPAVFDYGIYSGGTIQ